MSIEKTIKDLLADEALRSQLNSEGIKKFYQLMDEVKELQQQLKNRDETIGKEKERYQELLNTLTEVVEENSEWEKLDKSLSDREEKVKKDELIHALREKEIECEKKRVQDHKDMFSIVFKNQTVKR